MVREPYAGNETCRVVVLLGDEKAQQGVEGKMIAVQTLVFQMGHFIILPGCPI